MAINRVEVVINGNILSLQGDASEEHMQRVAKVINEKLGEIQETYEKSHLPASKLNQLLILNLADECMNRQEALEQSAALLEKAGQKQEEMQQQIDKLTAETQKLKGELTALKQAKHTHINRGR